MPRHFSRMDRVEAAILRAMASVLKKNAKDPRFQKANVTSVDISPDLSNSIIFVSVLDEEQATEIINALNRASGFLRRQLADEVDLRIAPKLHFRFDKSVSEGAKLSKLFDQLDVDSNSSNDNN